MSDLLTKVRSRGYWQIAIRPLAFEPRRVPDILDLEPILTKCVVRLRGWDFPHIDWRTRTQVDIDWIGQESDIDLHKGIWRFYQSGQFIYNLAMSIDWRDESNFWPSDAGWKPMTSLGVGDTLFTFAEIFEFASQLALTDAGDEDMRIDVKMGNVQGRELYVDSHRARWPFRDAHRATLQEYPFSLTKARSDLVANHLSYAIESAQEFFKRFGWEASAEVLKGWYDKRG